MLVASFQTNRSTMGESRTYEDFYKFLGIKPQALGVVSKLYEENTATYVTEAMRNIVYRDIKAPDKYMSLNTMCFEFGIETNNIKRIPFAAIPEGDGADGTEVTFYFKENYYQKYDIFKIDKTMQQFIVLYRPRHRSDGIWAVTTRIIDPDYRSVLDLSNCQIGDTTRFQSVAVPEYHEEGYSKYQSNVEKHRGYITTHRVDDSYSALFAAHEDVFVNMKGTNKEGKEVEKIYKMDSVKKNLLDNFMYVRSNGLLFNKTNVDENGKSTIMDPDLNRPIYIGDGIIPQIERYASKYAFSNLSVEVFQTIVSTMNEKAKLPTGNKYLFIVNERFWLLVQQKLSEFLFKFKTNGTYMWNKSAGDYIKVGATFDSYEFGGNTITFKVDRALTREYGTEKGYAIAIDLTADQTGNVEAPIQLFTLRGGDFINNHYLGVGGADGLTSGPVSSPVSGSKLINWGYAGVGVFNPYRSFIAREL